MKFHNNEKCFKKRFLHSFLIYLVGMVMMTISYAEYQIITIIDEIVLKTNTFCNKMILGR